LTVQQAGFRLCGDAAVPAAGDDSSTWCDMPWLLFGVKGKLADQLVPTVSLSHFLFSTAAVPDIDLGAAVPFAIVARTLTQLVQLSL
jgi:hypothetical protein